MLLGALVAAGAPEEWLRGIPERLGLPDVPSRCARSTAAASVPPRSTCCSPTAARKARASWSTHPHAHPHAHDDHHAPHRHVGELIAILAARAAVRVGSRRARCEAFELLGEAEGRIHGVPADQVALHEVGALDALVDIVGAIEGFEQLGIDRIYHRAGGGGQRVGSRRARRDPGARAGHGRVARGPGDRHRMVRSWARRRRQPARSCFACSPPGRRRRAGASWAQARGAPAAGIPRTTRTRSDSSWLRPRAKRARWSCCPPTSTT